jgi:hypothetical protein
LKTAERQCYEDHEVRGLFFLHCKF